MAARLTLICHAPTAATRAARFPLDEGISGIACGSAAVTAVPRRHLSLAGPERRTRETAMRLGHGVEIDTGLRDQDFGRWAGRRLADLAAAEPEAVAAWMQDPAAAPHGGESLVALLARVEAWMATRAAAGGRVSAVTHPAVVRAAVSAALDAGPAIFWRIEAPASATATLSHDGRRWTLTGLVPPP